MNITINSITLTNFKGVRSLQLQFDEQVTSVHGRNRTGKTTLADAINWCLFGKDSKGNTKFGIRTRDNDGNIIPDIPHEVEMVITCDDVRHTLRRSLRGDGTYAYFIDAGKTTAGEYRVFISQFVGEDTFKAITTPGYFTSLDWREQRKFLSDMVGEISNDQITRGEHRFDELLGILAQTDIENHIKHISYQIKQVQQDIERIPVRLEEQNKAMPEVSDDDKDLDTEIEGLRKALSDAQAEVTRAEVSGTDDARQKTLRDKLAFARRRIDNMERSARNQARELQDASERESRMSAQRISDAASLVTSLQNKIDANLQLIERTRETLTDCDKKAEYIRQQWAFNKSDKLRISDDDAVCPTCGQPLPEEQLMEKIGKMREDFNIRKQKKFDELKELADKIKEIQAKANSDIDEYQSIINGALADKQAAQQQLEALKSSASEELPVKTYQQILDEKPEYQQVVNEIKALEAELDGGTSSATDSQVIAELSGKADCIKQQLEALLSRQAAHLQADRIRSLIAGIEEERRNLLATLDSLQRQRDIAQEFVERSSDILEESVNAHFTFVKWKMFREYQNGNSEPYCECTHDGIPFSDLNSADRINAGLDIINTLSRFYSISAPIVIDNAESVNTIMQTAGQQIRLYVSEHDKLTIISP